MLGRVAVSNGPKQPFEIREYPVAEPGPDEILVKLTLASVCGSDLHMWRGETPPFQRPPGVPGHEMTGVIAQLGRDRRTDTLGRPLIVPGAATEIVPHDAVRQPKTLLGVLSYDAWVIPRALDWLVRARQRYPFDVSPQ